MVQFGREERLLHRARSREPLDDPGAEVRSPRAIRGLVQRRGPLLPLQGRPHPGVTGQKRRHQRGDLQPDLHDRSGAPSAGRIPQRGQQKPRCEDMEAVGRRRGPRPLLRFRPTFGSEGTLRDGSPPRCEQERGFLHPDLHQMHPSPRRRLWHLHHQTPPQGIREDPGLASET